MLPVRCKYMGEAGIRPRLLTLINLDFSIVNPTNAQSRLFLNQNPIEMKTLFTLSGLMVFTLLGAQTDPAKTIHSGKVVYEDKAKLEIHLEGVAAELANSLPKERKSTKSLLFNENASLYSNEKQTEADADQMAHSGGSMVMVRMQEPDNILFTDFADKKQVEQREFMTRIFLIEKDLGVPDWKLTGNTKEILGYPCQEAVREPNDSTKIVAWFTPSVPVSTGPGEYLNLPGLVLEVDLDNGDHTITAQSVEPMEVSDKMMVKPKKGKKVTEEEFKQIVDEKMKEMGAQGNGSGGQIMIRISK
jgi:GLPGLI family protein